MENACLNRRRAIHISTSHNHNACLILVPPFDRDALELSGMVVCPICSKGVKSLDLINQHIDSGCERWLDSKDSPSTTCPSSSAVPTSSTQPPPSATQNKRP